MKALGRHLIAEFYGCSKELLNSPEKIEQIMCSAAQRASATIINSIFHPFQPYGVSGVIVIAESHFAIHTWPEYKFASIDLYTCGEDVNPWIAYNYLCEIFKPQHSSIMELKRGVIHQRNLRHKPIKTEEFLDKIGVNH